MIFESGKPNEIFAMATSDGRAAIEATRRGLPIEAPRRAPEGHSPIYSSPDPDISSDWKWRIPMKNMILESSTP